MRMASVDDDISYEVEGDREIQNRKQYKAAFQPVEKTKEYIETTYFEMTDPELSTYYILINKFWSELAVHLSQAKPGQPFLSWKFMNLESVPAFVLALCFLPPQTLPQYSLSSKDDIIEVKADSPFLVFVKEAKTMPYEKKFGLLINQRVYDENQQIVED